MEWSSTGGRRQTPGETYSRLHHGVIFPLSSCQMKLLFPRPQISGLCNNQALCHRPSPGCRGEEASEGADSHKRSSSSPLTLRSGCRITSTAATMLHARCCSLQSSQRFGPANPLKHDIKLFFSRRLDSHTRTHSGHAPSHWPHYEKVSRSLRPTYWLLCFFFSAEAGEVMLGGYPGESGLMHSSYSWWRQ